MVEAIIKLLRRETSGLHQAAFLLGLFALLSQILALVRDKILASTFGAGADLDLYYAAFRIPDFLFVTLGSLVSLSVLIPFIVAQFEKGNQATRSFIDSIFSLFLFLIVSVSLVVFIFTPFLLKYLFPGFGEESLGSVIVLSRILLLSPLLLGISNLFGSLVQASNRFVVYAISPLVYNIGIISGILFLYKPFGLSGLAFGVVLGAFLHLVIQIPTVAHLALLPRITFRPDLKAVKDVAMVSLPRTIALSVSHISIFFLLSLASFMAEGSIAIFNLAWNLQSVPLSIFGVSYSLAAFPTLSRLYLAGERGEFLSQFTTSVRHVMFWLVPCTALFVVLRAHIVRIVLGSGAFDWTDTRLTAAVLALFVFSLIFQAIVLLCIRALYATGATGKPLFISILSGISIVMFSYTFSYLFQTSLTFRYFLEGLLKIPDVAGGEVVTLALGFTLGSIFEAALIWIYFTREWKEATKRVIRPAFQIASSAVFLGFFTYISLRFLNQFFLLSTFWGVFLQAIFSAFIGGVVWVLALFALGNEELPIITKTLHQKFWKTKPTSPDTDLL